VKIQVLVLRTAFWHLKVKVIHAIHCEAGIFGAVKLRTQNLQLPVLSLEAYRPIHNLPNLGLLTGFIKIQFFVPNIQCDIYFSYLDVSRYIPCTLDCPSEWWGAEVHGQLTDKDNPKTCTSFRHEQKIKEYFGYYINGTHISYTCYISTLCFCTEDFVRSLGAESRYFTPSFVSKLRPRKGNPQTG